MQNGGFSIKFNQKIAIECPQFHQMDLLEQKTPRNNTISILKSERMCSNGFRMNFIMYFRFGNFRNQRMPNTSFSGTDCAKEIK